MEESGGKLQHQRAFILSDGTGTGRSQPSNLEHMHKWESMGMRSRSYLIKCSAVRSMIHRERTATRSIFSTEVRAVRQRG